MDRGINCMNLVNTNHQVSENSYSPCFLMFKPSSLGQYQFACSLYSSTLPIQLFSLLCCSKIIKIHVHIVNMLCSALNEYCPPPPQIYYTVNSIQWAPHEFGLNLACSSSDESFSIISTSGIECTAWEGSTRPILSSCMSVVPPFHILCTQVSLLLSVGL